MSLLGSTPRWDGRGERGRLPRVESQPEQVTSRLFSRLAVAALFMLPTACATYSCHRPSIVRTLPGMPAGEMASLLRNEIRYPTDACLARRTGQAILRVEVLRGGSINKIWLHQSSGHEDLDAEALRAFQTLQLRGVKIKTWPPDIPPEKDKIIGEYPVLFTLP